MKFQVLNKASGFIVAKFALFMDARDFAKLITDRQPAHVYVVEAIE